MKKISAGIFIIFLLISFHTSALAQETNSTTGSISPTLRPRQVVRQDVQNVRQAAQVLKQDVKQIRVTPLATGSSAIKQKRCEDHVNLAKAREVSLSDRAFVKTNRLEAITVMVENFYANKLIPQGKTVSNYDFLVSDVNAKKAALSPLLDKVKADSSALTCENDAAKGQFIAFRTDADSLIMAFKAYRISILNLIKAVRDVAGNGPASGSASTSATPTAQ